MNSASAQPLSGIPPAAQPASHRAQDICARIDALLATLLLWATRTGLLGRAIAPQLHAIAGAFRALSVLLARLAAGDLPLPVMASTPSCRAVSCRTVSCRTVSCRTAHCAGPPARPRQSRARQRSAHPSPVQIPPARIPGHRARALPQRPAPPPRVAHHALWRPAFRQKPPKRLAPMLANNVSISKQTTPPSRHPSPRLHCPP